MNSLLNLNLFQNNKKYLLACSGGIDSIALFHLLNENSIEFDVATINYNFREESIKEVKLVSELCKSSNKNFYLYENKQNISSNLENVARDIRYDFFDKIMSENNYNALITAHNLNDKVEWFLMQFTKGAGISELTGISEVSYRNEYKLLKPLLYTERTDIEKYLSDNNYKAFHDKSNFDLSYNPEDKNPTGIKRNYFRHNFASKLTKDFKEGIKNSFLILEKEKEEFFKYSINEVSEQVIIISLENNNNINIINSIDYVLKRNFKHLLNKEQRKEILKQKETGIVINNIAIGFVDNKIIITPYLANIKLNKKEKEFFRFNKVPSKNRGFLKYNNLFFIFDFKNVL